MSLTDFVKDQTYPFYVSTDLSKYKEIENFKLEDLQAKHIIIRNEETEKIYKEAISGGHTNIMWGHKRGGTVESELKIINKMIEDNFQKSIRITITKNNIWSDNNHSTISYIWRNFYKIKEVPHYIVDLRTNKIRVVGKMEFIDWNYDSIEGAVKNAYRLKVFEENNGRVTSWKIQNLIDQLK